MEDGCSWRQMEKTNALVPYRPYVIPILSDYIWTGEGIGFFASPKKTDMTFDKPIAIHSAIRALQEHDIYTDYLKRFRLFGIVYNHDGILPILTAHFRIHHRDVPKKYQKHIITDIRSTYFLPECPRPAREYLDFIFDTQ